MKTVQGYVCRYITYAITFRVQENGNNNVYFNGSLEEGEDEEKKGHKHLDKTIAFASINQIQGEMCIILCLLFDIIYHHLIML